MKSQQIPLIELPKKPRRQLMQMIDAGCNPSGPGDIAQFQCKRCGHTSEWQSATATEIRKGVPCPQCSKEK